jgi:hypothetical protein
MRYESETKGLKVGRSRSLVHANCFVRLPPGTAELLTDETLVANAAPRDTRVIAAEELIDEDLAHRTSVAMAAAALDWFRAGQEDASIVSGVSAGDLAVAEATGRVLMPVARAVLAMTAALERGLEAGALVSVAPAGADRYARLETLAADAAAATVRARLGASLPVERIVSEDPRNAWLREKYRGLRDADYLDPASPRRGFARTLVLGLVNARARLARAERPALLVLEYNPTRHFARAYGASRSRRWSLVCMPGTPRDLLASFTAGDGAILRPPVDLATRPRSRADAHLRERGDELNGRALSVAGVELWPFVREPLLALAERHGRYAEAMADRLRGELRRHAVAAVLVPFDMPAPARLIVRVAQAIDIPAFVISDGFKADDIQQEGMTADVALAWSQAIAEHYFNRRADGAIVTGNPRAQHLARARAPGNEGWRVLVGAHAFSPIDLNCRRSDAERFLDGVLAGVAATGARCDARVVVKLHPADSPGYYRTIVQRHPRLAVDVRTRGDVVDLFADFDVYVATFSTSLLEAVAVGMPVVYYRVGVQRLGPPFEGDEFVARRCARTPAELAALLADRDTLAAPPPHGWIDYYLGPAAGAVERIIGAIDAQTVRRRNVCSPTA